MADPQRGAMELRVIAVSERAALRRASEQPRAAEQIRRRGRELLTDLEERVARDGGDPELLRRIEAARQDLHEG